ncbi:MAG: alpha-mannosidase [Clostridia bacterium]|nr:alpha-mannosidase [Clostridia bacterium]
MDIMHSEWKARIDNWIAVLKRDFYTPIGEISWEAFRTKDYLTPEQAAAADFAPVAPGFAWGETWEYCWFRGRVTLPEGVDGQRIVMNLAPGGESTLFVNGAAFGTYRADWISDDHHYMVDNYLTRDAKAGDSFDILMETYAGHHIPEVSLYSFKVGPVLPDGDQFRDPNPAGPRRTLGKCTYGIWNEDAYQLYMDVDTLNKLLQTLDDTSLRASKICDALEQFTLIVDFEQDREKRIAAYRAAREALRPAMEAVNGSSAPVFYAIGNAHLDLAWCWPLAETYRKTARTFAAQLRLLEEYPDYKFLVSQPACYEMVREHYPELFARIKAAAKTGRWIADGAMWVEPDTNMAGGEALIRQLIYGKRYYKEVFDVDSELLWLPDTFGYTAALPQILKKCGVKYLVTQKIFWSYNKGEPFPYHYFNWQGMDGSEIVSFLPTKYEYPTHPIEINGVWKNRSQARDLDAFLYPFGYGDGGGGPTRDHIEYAIRQKDLEGGVKIKIADPVEFFEDMQEQKGTPKNTYVGELYFTAHRGTYTTQAAVKRGNRKSELALRELEMWAVPAARNGAAYPAEKIEKLWKDVLLNQFHDILPGSSIERVYVEAEKLHDQVLAEAGQLLGTAQKALLRGDERVVTVFNSLGFARKALVSLPESFAMGAVTADGTYVPVASGCGACKALVTLPACGAISLTPASEAKPAETGATVTAAADGFVMENAHVKAVVNARGEVISFVLKESGREFADGAMNRFRLFKDIPRRWDNWDIDSNYVYQEIDGAYDIQVEAVGSGIEAVLKVTGKLLDSTYTQYIRLSAESKRIEFETEVDWKELHRLLKVGFPVDVYAENAINEMQFGYVERPTHRSRLYDKERFEVCNHHYTALKDNAHGAALLNDCKYGISVNGNSMELTLLRSGTCPDFRTDNRVHHFTYAFTAWEGDFASSDVVKQGYELNVTPVVVEGGALDASYLSVDRDNIMIETVKLAEDGSGDVIVRLYEAKKAACSAKLCVNFGGDFTAYSCDMLENKEEELAPENGAVDLAFKAFEIKTVRLAAKK